MINFIMTNDVECFSFETNDIDESVVERIEKEGMPKLLELYDKYDIKATFFFTAKFAELSPDSVRSVVDREHEIGCHGYDHKHYYDSMSYQKQLKMLTKSKEIIEDIAKSEVVSFRAPALRINEHIVKALEKAGFKYDSSVAPQRFDGPFTSGAIKKLEWLTAERNPYFMSHKNPFKKGDSDILEVPLSAILWPFIGTHMRICPFITKQIMKLLAVESQSTDKPLVFLFHPNECLEFEKKGTSRRGNFISDYLRHRIKMRNLGREGLKLLESYINYCKENEYQFLTIREWGELF